MNTNIEQKYSIIPFFEKFGELLKEKIGEKDKPLILLQGGFGKHNTGDDTLMLVAREQILRHYPKAEIVVLCHNPKFLEQDYKIKGVKFKSLRIFYYLFKCDALVVPAGGLTNNIDYNSYIRSLFNPRGKFVIICMLISVLRHRYTVLFGIGIHEIPDFIVRFLLEITLPRLDLIDVRDNHTVKYVQKIGCKEVYFSHDPAIAYYPKQEMEWETYKCKWGIQIDDFIVINYRMVKNAKDSQTALRELSAYIKYIAEKYPSMGIVLMPFSIHPHFPLENDVIAMKKLLDSTKEYIDQQKITLLEEYLTADEVKLIAGHASLLILTRHHAPVLTYSCHIPTIVVSYNYKCREFAVLGDYRYIIDYDKLTSRQLEEITDAECGQYKGEN